MSSRGILVAAILVVASAAGALTTATPAIADSARPAAYGCTSAVAVTFRGSGETDKDAVNYTALLSSDGWDGRIIGRALHAYETTAIAEGFDPSKTLILDVGPNDGYKAISVHKAQDLALKDHSITGAYSRTLFHIMESAKQGTTAGLRKIQRETNALDPGCAMPFYVGIGYSQGAMALRMMYATYGQGGPLRAVMTFGDPFQEGRPASGQKAAGLEGTGADGRGLYTRSWYRGEAENSMSAEVKEHLSDIYTGAADRFLLCHRNDPFCDFFAMPNLLFAGEHENYGVDRAEKAVLGKWLTHELNGEVPKPAAPVTASWSVNADLAPWWPGWEARIETTGIPRSGILRFDLVKATSANDDPWDPKLEKVAELTALPGLPGEHSPISDRWDPPFVPRGSHGIAVPSDLPGGIYFLRLKAASTKVSAVVRIDDRIGIGWTWEDKYSAPGCGVGAYDCTQDWLYEHGYDY